VVYVYLAYYVAFFVYELVGCNVPCAHRVWPITDAYVEQLDFFDAAVL